MSDHQGPTLGQVITFAHIQLSRGLFAGLQVDRNWLNFFLKRLYTDSNLEEHFCVCQLFS